MRVIPMSDRDLAVALDALCVRANWYYRRRYDVPADVRAAIEAIAGSLDLCVEWGDERGRGNVRAVPRRAET